MIRLATDADASTIAGIYNHYILNSVATFELELLQPEEIRTRVQTVQSLGLPWFVMESEGQITGYAYASKHRERAAYRPSVEGTVYLHPEHLGKGYGFILYKAVIDAVSKLDWVHSIIGGVALPNPASSALHKKLGFEKVAHYKEIGFKFDKWIDTEHWQLMIKRQSLEAEKKWKLHFCPSEQGRRWHFVFVQKIDVFKDEYVQLIVRIIVSMLCLLGAFL